MPGFTPMWAQSSSLPAQFCLFPSLPPPRKHSPVASAARAPATRPSGTEAGRSLVPTQHQHALLPLCCKRALRCACNSFSWWYTQTAGKAEGGQAMSRPGLGVRARFNPLAGLTLHRALESALVILSMQIHVALLRWLQFHMG